MGRRTIFRDIQIHKAGSIFVYTHGRAHKHTLFFALSLLHTKISPKPVSLHAPNIGAVKPPTLGTTDANYDCTQNIAVQIYV